LGSTWITSTFNSTVLSGLCSLTLIVSSDIVSILDILRASFCSALAANSFLPSPWI
jgi:hypothetical protein